MSQSPSPMDHPPAMAPAATSPPSQKARAGLTVAATADDAHPGHGDQVVSFDTMVRMLQDASALGRGAPPVERREAVDVAVLLDALVRQRGTDRIRLIGPEAPVHALADLAALSLLFQILLDNALSQYAFTAPARAVIRVDHGASALVVHVDDNGPGVPVSLRTRVFDPSPLLTASLRLKNTQSPELANAQKIAQAHGGAIAISSSPEGGARLTVRLPLLGLHETELASAS